MEDKVPLRQVIVKALPTNSDFEISATIGSTTTKSIQTETFKKRFFGLRGNEKWNTTAGL